MRFVIKLCRAAIAKWLPDHFLNPPVSVSPGWPHSHLLTLFYTIVTLAFLFITTQGKAMDYPENAEFWTAFAKSKKKYKTPAKDQTNQFTKQKYWSLQALNDAARTAFGTAFTFYYMNVHAEEQVGAELVLVHNKSGATRSWVTMVDKTQRNEQGCGTGYTYAKRYAMMALFALGDPENDNDAQYVTEKPADELAIQDLQRRCQEAGMPAEVCLRHVKSDNWQLSEAQMQTLEKLIEERTAIEQQDKFL